MCPLFFQSANSTSPPVTNYSGGVFGRFYLRQDVGLIASLAGEFSQGDDIVPIPGTKRPQYLKENVAASNITLTPEELERIDELSPKDAAAGERYPDIGIIFDF